MWSRLGQTKNKFSPTWRQDESSAETEGDRTGYNVETKENVTKMSLQRGDEGKRKIIPQVVRVNSPRIRHGTT